MINVRVRNSRVEVEKIMCGACAVALLVGTACSSSAQKDAVSLVSPDADSFLEQCAGRGAQAEEAGTMAVKGNDGFLFLGAELLHLGKGMFWGSEAVRASASTKPENADPADAIIDFHEQLKAQGIRLLFVPVPPKAVVYPDKLVEGMAAPTHRIDPFHQAFYAHLRASGVDVVDLAEAFLAARAGAGEPVYCRQDTHWSGRGCILAGEQIAAAIGDAEWRTAHVKQDFTSAEESLEIRGDLWAALNDESIPRESIQLRKVVVEPDADSPVLLLGDSHTLVFHSGGDMHAQGAGLVEQLSLELGFPVDLIGVRGSGSTSSRLTLYRKAARDPAYWSKKKVVVYCVTARDLTESIDGWKKLPIRK